jgi:hypothetical protein
MPKNEVLGVFFTLINRIKICPALSQPYSHNTNIVLIFYIK